jgi:hypothetical protein
MCGTGFVFFDLPGLLLAYPLLVIVSPLAGIAGINGGNAGYLVAAFCVLISTAAIGWTVGWLIGWVFEKVLARFQSRIDGTAATSLSRNMDDIRKAIRICQTVTAVMAAFILMKFGTSAPHPDTVRATAIVAAFVVVYVMLWQLALTLLLRRKPAGWILSFSLMAGELLSILLPVMVFGLSRLLRKDVRNEFGIE